MSEDEKVEITEDASASTGEVPKTTGEAPKTTENNDHVVFIGNKPFNRV